MTDASAPDFTPEQLREAYEFQARQGYVGDMGRTAAAMKLAGDDADDDQIEHLSRLIRVAIDELGSPS